MHVADLNLFGTDLEEWGRAWVGTARASYPGHSERDSFIGRSLAREGTL